MKNFYKNILLFFFLIFLPIFVWAASDSLNVEQYVDNTCNQNLVCESELNEDIVTCPTDCHKSHTILDTIREALKGDSIKVSNIQVNSSLDSENKVIISWETNKDSKSVLIWNIEDGVGGTLEEELFTKIHSMEMDNFDFTKEYFFKIFTIGVFGDDNYSEREEFIIKPSNLEVSKSKEADIESEVGEEEVMIEAKKNNSQFEVIIKSEQGLNKIPSFLNKIWEKTSAVCEASEEDCVVNNSSVTSFLDEYKFQTLISLGILFFVILGIKKRQRV